MVNEGGQLVLINATPYAWNTKSQSQYQMNAWKFPASVAPSTFFIYHDGPVIDGLLPSGAVTSIYVEWNEGLLTTISDDGGDVQFQLDGLSTTFSLHARAPNKNFNIQVSFDNLSTANNPAGSTINLGWNHNGNMPFILSGTSGNFWSTNPPAAWMQNMLPVMGKYPLRQIVMPGSHDSGMSALTGRTIGGVTGNILTQSLNIGGQLSAGARYFDLRPVIAAGQFSSGHYSYINSVLNWQGGDGELFDDIISQINAFTASNAELIILNLSHDLDTDGTDYEFFTQDQYTSLLAKLSGLNNLFITTNPTTVDLTKLTLNDYIGKGHAAVVVICDPSTGSVTLGDYAKKGFFTASQFNMVNLYANSNDLNTMASDQLSKMTQYRPTPTSEMFLLSWTLTQQVSDMTKLTSIRDLANQADNAVYQLLIPKITTQSFPNILYFDNFVDSSLSALAIAMNHMVLPAIAGRDVSEQAKRRHLAQTRHRFKN